MLDFLRLPLKSQEGKAELYDFRADGSFKVCPIEEVSENQRSGDLKCL